MYKLQAQEVEENMLKKAKKMLMDSVAQPATQSDSNPAGASAAGSIVEVPASAEAVSELSAASAARPASESMTLTLPDVLSMLERESLQADAQQLLQDGAVLQEWQRAGNPSHKLRDAMLKLGTLWDVPRQVAGKKRPPAEVAQELEENMLKKAKRMLSGMVPKLSLIHI